MGVAMYAAAWHARGNVQARRILVWIVLAGAAVAVGDGCICRVVVRRGKGGHRGYAPMLGFVGGWLVA